MIDVTVYALWGLDENGNGVADVLENKALLVFRVVNGRWQPWRQNRSSAS